jgi:O-antigen/teichoic acid export membrane protein
MKTALLLDCCVFIIQIGGLLALAYLGVLSANRAYLVGGGACGIGALSWLAWTRKAFALRPAEVISHLGRNWSLGKWVCAGSIVFAIGVLLYPWILTGFHGTAATAVFSACMGVVSLSNPFILGMSNILGPKASHAYALGGGKEVRFFVFKATALLAAPVGLFCLAAGLFGDQFVVLMYGSKYAGHGVLVWALALGVLAWVLTIPIGFGLCAMERPDVNFKVNLISFGAMLTLGLWLVKSFGPLGVAYGLLIGHIGASTARYIIFARLIQTNSVPGNEQ